MIRSLVDFETELSARANSDLSKLPPQEQHDYLKSRSAQMLRPDALLAKLTSAAATGRPLVVKYGIDPTSPDAHLGHMVPLLLANALQRMGHHLTLVIGDFTAHVGDPSGRVSTRPVLSAEAIAENIRSYELQVAKFVDLETAEIVLNSTFYVSMSINQLFTYYREVKISALLQRDDFRARIDGLTAAEALYPTLMAIDSVHIVPDVELGGIDQLLNFQITIDMMERLQLEPESALTTELLLGTSGDGSKMSKSRNNFIAVLDPPQEVFGKVMSIPDSLVTHYFRLLTEVTGEELSQLTTVIDGGGPAARDVKRMLARSLVARLHSEAAAKTADTQFAQTFGEGKISSMPSNLVYRGNPSPRFSWRSVLRTAEAPLDG